MQVQKLAGIGAPAEEHWIFENISSFDIILENRSKGSKNTCAHIGGKAKVRAIQPKIKSPENKFYTDAFEKTSEDRRQQIFDVAVSEFARNGYSATNINVIAKRANVSIGAMYSYFASKEDLFLAIVEQGFKLLETALNEVNVDDGHILVVIERLLRVSRDYALKFPELNQIYLDLATQGLSSLSSRLSRQLETVTADMYRNLIRKAKQDGTISAAVDENIISFCLDNLIMMFQFSFTSDYYKERMRIFLDDSEVRDEEEIIRGVMRFIKKALV